MGDKGLDARLLENMRRGLKELAAEHLGESGLDLNAALDQPWTFNEGEFGQGLSAEQISGIRMPRAAWRAGLEALAALHVSRLAEEYAWLLKLRCQSAIEETFFVALVVAIEARDHRVITPTPYYRTSGCCDTGRRTFPISVQVCPQHHIGQVHVDFYISLSEAVPVEKDGQIATGWNEDRLLVEIDGHDFHEKTKDQAQRDKKRDRELQKLGFPVYRYTGSEVWRDPFAIANEVLGILWKNVTGVEQ